MSNVRSHLATPMAHVNPQITLATALAAFEAELAREGEGIYVPPHSDARSVEASIRAHLCEPFLVSASVVEPGFPFASVGSLISGFCVAKTEGYWLVYQPEEHRFLCFWGGDQADLGAHGVYGNPLYCWAA